MGTVLLSKTSLNSIPELNKLMDTIFSEWDTNEDKVESFIDDHKNILNTTCESRNQVSYQSWDTICRL